MFSRYETKLLLLKSMARVIERDELEGPFQSSGFMIPRIQQIIECDTS